MQQRHQSGDRLCRRLVAGVGRQHAFIVVEQQQIAGAHRVEQPLAQAGQRLCAEVVGLKCGQLGLEVFDLQRDRRVGGAALLSALHLTHMQAAAQRLHQSVAVVRAGQNGLHIVRQASPFEQLLADPAHIHAGAGKRHAQHAPEAPAKALDKRGGQRGLAHAADAKHRDNRVRVEGAGDLDQLGVAAQQPGARHADAFRQTSVHWQRKVDIGLTSGQRQRAPGTLAGVGHQ